MKYSAINIGPIIATLGMARKPRELWAASFLFSHLMKCIYAEAEDANITIISPAKPDIDKNKVGIFPDRIYFKGDIDVKRVIGDAIWSFYTDLLGINTNKTKNPDLSYFNIMSTSCDADKESIAIACLNQQLDVLELCNYATDGDAAQTIYEIISETKNSPLFDLADGKYIKNIKTIEEIANAQIQANPEVEEKMYHRYFCVVQADGDNVGKTVSHNKLQDGQVKQISNKLVQFGLDATYLIESFGGLPIYAGGDDLLFIAPVIGKDGTHIFKLLDAIENQAFKGVHDVVDELRDEENERLKDKDGNIIEASLSFGISISYYKHPLYEAFESARNLLFCKAKNIKQKKAVAWSLRKHSGGTFEATFSLKNQTIKKQFADLIKVTSDNDTISAIAHKIRQNEALINVVLESENIERLDSLFDKVLAFDSEKKDYFDAVKSIMPTLYKLCEEENKDRKDSDKNRINFIQTLYSLLRTAKFLKGEDLRDE